jgi:hypothetical protein
MDNDDNLRQQLLALLGGGNAHMRFDQAVANFPPEDFNRGASNSDYTPWRLLEHIRIAQWDILEFIRNPQYVSPPWPEGYWPQMGESADQARWEKTLQDFRSDQEALYQMVADPATDLLASFPHAPGYNLLREVLVLADHNAYHMGEFALLRQVMKTWTEDSSH